ncbi:MAG: thioredoxin family protein [Planctomycetes bacterium]|nr:thioredoxin family protein [Planctomycetota bacterium]
MQKKVPVIISLILILACNALAAQPANTINADMVTISAQQQHDVVSPGTESVLAIHFELKKNWHFYASAETAPGSVNLKIKPSAEKNLITFSQPIFPQSQSYFDKFSGKTLDVFGGKFTAFLPFTVNQSSPPGKIDIVVAVEGAVCSDMLCSIPNFGFLTAQLEIAADAATTKPNFTLPDTTPPATSETKRSAHSTLVALGLAFLAGLILNIMPCVLPVIPLKVLSIFEQAKESKARCIAMGLSFCLGILLFFAALAILNIVLRLGYGTVFQWGDHFRNPIFLVAMTILMVVLALFMFGTFTFIVPSAISQKSGPAKGIPSSIGMGFLAAILSTPCSFAILTAVFAWAQTQQLALSTLAIMLIGLGMAAPYAILTSMPGSLKYLPKSGRWTELFKQSMGFVLLIVAVWLLSVLLQLQKENILYFTVIFAFSIWMWVSWVTPTTSASRKITTRVIALAIAVAAGLWLLPTPKTAAIDWQKYDAKQIASAAKTRPVLVEFMADWCLTCKVVEKTVYSRKDIADLIKQKAVLPVKADTTSPGNPATIDLKEIYKEPGVPVTILFVPTQTEPIRLHGLIIGEKLKQLLEDLPDKTQ